MPAAEGRKPKAGKAEKAEKAEKAGKAEKAEKAEGRKPRPKGPHELLVQEKGPNRPLPHKEKVAKKQFRKNRRGLINR